MQAETKHTQIRASAGKYLTFSLSNETYGIAVSYVREILGVAPITVVPNTPKYIKGVMNLRGKIVPLIDLRIKLSMEASDFTRQSCIIVVEIPGASERILLGVIVDAVKEVQNVAEQELEEVPSFGVRVNTSFLLAIAKNSAGLALLLDIERVLSQEELLVVENATPDVVPPQNESAEVAASSDVQGSLK